MTQKTLNSEQVTSLLQTIDPSGIADKGMRQTVELLLNLVEQLDSEVKKLRDENQQLRDENNRLKGESGKPEIKAKKPRGEKTNHDSEKERKVPKNHEKGFKNSSLEINRSLFARYPSELLPDDAEFKGYEEVIVQDIKLTTDNILFRKEKYYSASAGKTYLAELPVGYEGEFGPGVKALVISLYYGSNMTQSKVLDFLSDIGISMSAGHLSNLLIKDHSEFHAEKSEIYSAGLDSTPWQHFDQTSARVAGANYTTNIICNPFYTIYFTTAKKDRLTVLQSLQDTKELEFILNHLTYQLLEKFPVSQLAIENLKLLPQERVFSSKQFNALLDKYLPKLSRKQRTNVLEAAAIAFYHHQSNWPVVQALVCDDAPQFKLLTPELSLCWVHEGRHYKKLSPLIAYHQKLLDEFLKSFWDYYKELLAYRTDPSYELAMKLRSEFSSIFNTKSGYSELDERKQLTFAKIEELLLVLEHPQLPLNNNPAELGARTMVQRRNISYGTQNNEGTKAWDTFMSLVATTRKLGISFFQYVRDRITRTDKIEPLAQIIYNNQANNLPDWSW